MPTPLQRPAGHDPGRSFTHPAETHPGFRLLPYKKEEFPRASNRLMRINEEIQKELSGMIRNLKDPRVQDTMISITRVETTPDLRYAKVYVSFLQEDRAAEALKGLKSASGYLRRELGSVLRLHHTPDIQWALDDSITYGARMLALINSLEVNSDDHADEG